MPSPPSRVFRMRFNPRAVRTRRQYLILQRIDLNVSIHAFREDATGDLRGLRIIAVQFQSARP